MFFMIPFYFKIEIFVNESSQRYTANGHKVLQRYFERCKELEASGSVHTSRKMRNWVKGERISAGNFSLPNVRARDAQILEKRGPNL